MDQMSTESSLGSRERTLGEENSHIRERDGNGRGEIW